MKKLIVALAAVAMTAGMALNAQQACPNAQNCPRDKQCPVQCDSTCTKPCAKPCAPKQCAFDNLNLTDAQKQQLKALCEKQKQCKKDAKADRMAAKKERLQAIKGILTPEQYVTFLENHFINGGGNKYMQRAGRHGHGPKQMQHHGRRVECVKK